MEHFTKSLGGISFVWGGGRELRYVSDFGGFWREERCSECMRFDILQKEITTLRVF